MKIFISHAVADLELVRAFVSLLKEIGVPPASIFCTSLKGHGIPAGHDFKIYIRDQFEVSDFVIALISENYYASAFCMSELGAVWITAKQNFYPFVVPPVSFKDLKGPLAGTQCLQIAEKGSLSELYDALRTSNKHICNTPMWDESSKSFTDEVPTILAKLPATTAVDRAKHEGVLKDLDSYKNELQKSRAETEEVRKELAAVSKLKDRELVRKAVSSFRSQWEQFDELAKSAEKALAKLPNVVVDVLFHKERHETFYFPQDDADEFKGAIQDGQICEDDSAEADPGSAFCADSEDPNVETAISKLRTLRKFVGAASETFEKDYKTKFRERLDMKLRPFWVRHLGLL